MNSTANYDFVLKKRGFPRGGRTKHVASSTLPRMKQKGLKIAKGIFWIFKLLLCQYSSGWILAVASAWTSQIRHKGFGWDHGNLTAKLSPWEAICMFTVIPQSPNRCLWCHGMLCFWCQCSPSEDWTRQEHLSCYELWFQNATVLLHMMLWSSGWSHDRKRPHVFIRMLHASCFSSLLPRWCSGRWIVSLCLMLWFLTFIHTFRDVNRQRLPSDCHWFCMMS